MDLKPITIDPKEIIVLADKGSQLVLTRQADEELRKLLELQKWINKMVDSVREKIEKAGVAIDEGFNGVKGEFTQAIRRRYGAVYGYQEERMDIAEPFLIRKETVSYSVDTEKVKKHLKEHQELPAGIYENARIPKTSLKLKKEI